VPWEKITIDSELKNNSTNPVQNKIVEKALSDKLDKTKIASTSELGAIKVT